MLVRTVASLYLDMPTGPSWSDGFGGQHWVAASAVDLTCCGCCNHLFWTIDVEPLGRLTERPESLDWPWQKRLMIYLGIGFQNAREAETQWKSIKEKWHWAQYADSVKENTLLWAIENGAGTTPERELILRRRLWWANNHPRRGRKYLPPMSIEQERQNMTRLLELVRHLPEEKRQPFTEGELLRELGLFDESLTVFEREVAAGNQQVTALMRLARENNSSVHEFTANADAPP
jgi:hypothetical protein